MPIYSAPRVVAFLASDLEDGMTLGDLRAYVPGAVLVACGPHGTLTKGATTVGNPKATIDLTKDYMLVTGGNQGGNRGGADKKEGKGGKGGKEEGGKGGKGKKGKGGKGKGGDKEAAAAAPAAGEFTEKQKKKAIKEGGKKGQDLAGLSDLGGVKHFTIAMHDCEGDMGLLKDAMGGMNKEVVEGGDDRKGGAGGLAKMLLAANEKQVCCLAHVPEDLKATISLEEWMSVIANALGATGDFKPKDNMLEFIIKGNAEAGKFPLKMRDEAINASFAFLKEKSLVIDDESSDDDVNLAEAAGIEW